MCSAPMATLRYTIDEPDDAKHISRMAGGVLPDLANEAGIAGVHLLVADLQASGEVTAEQRARGDRNAVPRFALLVEGWGDREQFVSLLRSGATATRLADAGVSRPLEFGFYQQQIALSAPASTSPTRTTSRAPMRNG